jgi:hypothetical protein
VPGQGWWIVKVWYPPPLGRVVPTAQTSVADPGTALMPVIPGWPSGPAGVVSGAHDVPFQCRTDVVPPGAPAAQTLAVELAVTDASEPPLPRFGSVATDHAVPFQCIAIGLAGWAPQMSLVPPTAHASFGEISTTPFSRWLTPQLVGTAGFGLETIVQAEPFQCIVSVKLSLLVPFRAVK